MRSVYCDNSSTSFPKAPGLGKIIGDHIENNGFNVSRGAYERAYSVEKCVIETRETACEFFGGNDIGNLVFTSGATEGLNLILKGALSSSDHVLTTSMEHNAVVRPLNHLMSDGVYWEEVECDSEGFLSVEKLEKAIKPETKMVLVTHGSNVCGTMTPIEEIGRICKKHNVFFCVDASQTAGDAPINIEDANIDALAFPAHKGLMGPQGIGGVLMSGAFAEYCRPIIEGGTGSFSHEDTMPCMMPDKFQAGTMNIPGIVGMKHALEFIKAEGRETIHDKKMRLTGMFLEDLLNMSDIRIIGPEDTKNRCPVVSVDFENADNGEISYVLEKEFGIMTRCGLHCAPHAHKTLGTFPKGTVRFSFGHFNTEEDIAYAIDAINRILKEYV